MAFQQYNSAAVAERERRQKEYEKYLAKKMSKKEDERQKKYGFSLYNLKDHLKEDYDGTSLPDMGVDTMREGKIYTYEPPNSNDGKMSPALRDVLHPPVIGDRIDSKTILLKPSAKKSNSRTAKKWHKDRQNYTRKKGKKGKKTRDPPPAAVGGRRRKRKKQRGGNTPECRTREYTYAELENRIGETFYVKVPPGEFWQDGNYILKEYNINGDRNAGRGIGLVGAGDGSDIDSHEVRICKLDDGSEEKRQAGGRRKKRKKTRKNKRSKKRRVKKRKTRKRRRKRR